MSNNHNDFFIMDLENLQDDLQLTAKSIFDYCVDVLSAEVHYRKERYIKQGGGQRHTIMKIPSTRTFFIVIDLQKSSRLRLAFPDKNDKCHSWNAQWCSSRQGENGKREKQIDITKELSQDEISDLQNQIGMIYENALNYYNRAHDSTKTWQRMFGTPSRDYPRMRATELTEIELCKVYDKGVCSVCGSESNIEIGWSDGRPAIYCMYHNPQKSPFIHKAGSIIPFDVREYVWHRDKGQGLCGHNQYLHYDHLIPRSKGGSNTENNIILKCRSCNLSKSDKLIP